MKTDDLSKQQRWQLKNSLNGNCVRCGKKSDGKKNCPDCRRRRRRAYRISVQVLPILGEVQ